MNEGQRGEIEIGYIESGSVFPEDGPVVDDLVQYVVYPGGVVPED